VLFAIVGVIAPFLLSTKQQEVMLPDWTKLKLVGVTYGTNSFLHGNVLERLLFNRVRATQVSVGPLKLKRPISVSAPSGYPGTETDCLNIFFETTPSIAITDALRNAWAQDYRLIAVGESGFYESNPRPWSGARLFCLRLNSYPRTESQFTLKVLKRSDTNWNVFASFRVHNPNVEVPEKWSEQPLPITNEVDGVRIVLGGASMTDPFARTWNTGLWFKFLEVDSSLGSFRFRGGFDSLTDASGNFSDVFGHPYETNGWTLFRGHYSLDTNHLWRLNGHVFSDKRFPKDGFIEFDQIPGTGEEVAATNGLVVLASLQGSSLRLRFEGAGANRSIKVLSAQDEHDHPVSVGHLDGSPERGWTAGLSAGGLASAHPKTLRVTAEIQRVYPVDFVFRPNKPLPH